MSEDHHEVPKVVLCVGGGLASLQVVRNAIEADPPVPIIVVANSGGAAAHVAEEIQLSERKPKAEMRESLKKRGMNPADIDKYKETLDQIRELVKIRKKCPADINAPGIGCPGITLFSTTTDEGGEMLKELIVDLLRPKSISAKNSVLQLVKWGDPEMLQVLLSNTEKRVDGEGGVALSSSAPLDAVVRRRVVNALGWSIGDECVSTITHKDWWLEVGDVSTITHEDWLKVGDVGKVVGPGDSSGTDNAQRLLVEFRDGKRLNMLAKKQIITVAEHRRQVVRLAFQHVLKEAANDPENEEALEMVNMLKRHVDMCPKPLTRPATLRVSPAQSHIGFNDWWTLVCARSKSVDLDTLCAIYEKTNSDEGMTRRRSRSSSKGGITIPSFVDRYDFAGTGRSAGRDGLYWFMHHLEDSKCKEHLGIRAKVDQNAAGAAAPSQLPSVPEPQPAQPSSGAQPHSPSQLPPHSTTSSLPSSAGYAASAGAAAALDSTNSAPPPRVTLRVAWSDVFLWSVLVNITANYPRLCGTNAVSLCALPWLPAACARDATASQIHPMSGGKKLRQTLRRYAALCFSTLEHVPCPRVHMPSGLLPMECHARIDLIQRAHTAPRSAPLNCWTKSGTAMMGMSRSSSCSPMQQCGATQFWTRPLVAA